MATSLILKDRNGILETITRKEDDLRKVYLEADGSEGNVSEWGITVAVNLTPPNLNHQTCAFWCVLFTDGGASWGYTSFPLGGLLHESRRSKFRNPGAKPVTAPYMPVTFRQPLYPLGVRQRPLHDGGDTL